MDAFFFRGRIRSSPSSQVDANRTSNTKGHDMQNKDSETLIPLNDAPKHIPNRPHRATCWRWALRGIQRSGETVKLKTTAVGARRYTTRADIAEFLARCNGQDANQQPVVGDAFKRRAEAAGNVLESMGVRAKPERTRSRK
jgi:hypothetical protein